MIKKYATRCGGTVVVPQKTEEHLRAHPEVREILAEAIGKVSLPQDGEFLATEVEMGKVIGVLDCIKTPIITPQDTTFFARRVRRNDPIRVVKDDGNMIEATTIVVLAKPQKKSGVYTLVSAWVGHLNPKEPGDKTLARGSREYQESLNFWCSHALIYNPEVMGEIFESSWEKILEN